jgi:hypothetical protein
MPTKPGLRRRNPVALSPLLRKGGVHERSKSGLRAEAKQQLHDELEFWQEEREEEYLSTTIRSRINSGNITSYIADCLGVFRRGCAGSRSATAKLGTCSSIPSCF